MAVENLSYKEAITIENNSYASAVRSNSERNTSTPLTPRKRRITQYTPNISDEFRKAHNDILAIPSTSNRRGTCINKTLYQESENLLYNLNLGNIVNIILEFINENTSTKINISNELEVKKIIQNKIGNGANSDFSISSSESICN
ncbi:hypothetical protein WA026_019248 [Henosepilachna vigintioctopunctata]|uniref:Uncharacterized protein n=1 Tax=Henosepilachna vigintioctopunctata TaxID=420089 RepID=A0AAW1UWZ8_9CUCU